MPALCQTPFIYSTNYYGAPTKAGTVPGTKDITMNNTDDAVFTVLETF